MSWNVEIVAVRAVDPDDAVPFVFGPTETTMGFESATSAERGVDLCVGRIGDWVVVLDVGCRLTGNDAYLAEASESTELHAVRIADEPVAVHYRGGTPVARAAGRAACLALAPVEDGLGETCAWSLLEQRTGLALFDKLFDARFTLYTLD